MEMQLATPPHNREAAWAYEVLLRWLNQPFENMGTNAIIEKMNLLSRECAQRTRASNDSKTTKLWALGK